MAALAALAVWQWRSGATPAATVRFEVAPPKNATFAAEVEEHNLALSPDGSMIAFVAGSAGQKRVWLRRLGRAAAEPLLGTEDAGSVFWSPDSSFLGFFAGGKMKKVAVNGGSPQEICSMTGANASASWGSDGTILFSEFQGRRGLLQVSAAGGEPRVLLETRAQHSGGPAQSDEIGFYRWPHWLPGGKQFIATGFGKQHGVYVIDAQTGKSRLLLPLVTRAEYAAGHLFYVRERVLVAQSFDAGSAQLRGEPIQIAQPLPVFLTGWAPFAVSAAGIVSYQSGESDSEVLLFDRAGQLLRRLGGRAAYSTLSLSPEGRRAAVEIADAARANSDLWIYDIERGVSTRFTSEFGYESMPVWSPDSAQIAYAAHGLRPDALMVQRVTGGGQPELAAPQVDNFQFPSDWSADGRFIIYDQASETGFDIWAVPTQGDRKPFLVHGTRFNEGRAKLSPDGRWLLYLSDEAGRSEAYLRPFRQPGEQIRVSTAGANAAMWGKQGREIIYLGPDGQLFSVPVNLGKQISVSQPQPLFRTEWAAVFRVKGTGLESLSSTSDGQRFLIIAGGGPEALPVTVVLNWQAKASR